MNIIINETYITREQSLCVFERGSLSKTNANCLPMLGYISTTDNNNYYIQ